MFWVQQVIATLHVNLHVGHMRGVYYARRLVVKEREEREELYKFVGREYYFMMTPFDTAGRDS